MRGKPRHEINIPTAGFQHSQRFKQQVVRDTAITGTDFNRLDKSNAVNSHAGPRRIFANFREIMKKRPFFKYDIITRPTCPDSEKHMAQRIKAADKTTTLRLPPNAKALNTPREGVRSRSQQSDSLNRPTFSTKAFSVEFMPVFPKICKRNDIYSVPNRSV